MSQYFKVGDLVRKRAGYEYPGIIVSVFTTRAGAVRYVVEADHPRICGDAPYFQWGATGASSLTVSIATLHRAPLHVR